MKRNQEKSTTHGSTDKEVPAVKVVNGPNGPERVLDLTGLLRNGQQLAEAVMCTHQNDEGSVFKTISALKPQLALMSKRNAAQFIAATVVPNINLSRYELFAKLRDDFNRGIEVGCIIP